MSLLRKPLAWIPIVLPVGIIAMLLHALATNGLVRQADEGVAAHVFQLWIVLEPVLIAWFALRSLPRQPRQTSVILGLQIALSFIPVFIVFYYDL